jgi:hypothetical protein
MTTDKQLRGIKLADVLEMRRLDQALNVKEFAVLAGISYSVAREWFQIKGFPRVQGVVFWTDFVELRNSQNGINIFLKAFSSRTPPINPLNSNVRPPPVCPPAPLKFFSKRRNKNHPEF